MTGTNEELTQPVSYCTERRWHRRCVMIAPHLAAIALGGMVGYLAGVSSPEVAASLLPAILSLAGAGVIAIGSKDKGNELGICTSSFLLMWFLISLLIGTHVGGWRRDIFARVELAEVYAQDGSWYLEELRMCSILEVKMNAWRTKVLNLPPLTFSQVCPSMATVQATGN